MPQGRGESGKKLAERPSAATTYAPSGRPSLASSAAQPLISGSADIFAPEHTAITVSQTFSRTLLSGASYSNLVPREDSLIGRPASVPAGSITEELAGLSSEEAARLQLQYGRNEIPEISTPWYILLGKQFVGVMPLMLEIAALVAAVIPDWPDFAIIMAMLVLNSLIGFHEEHKAKQSLDALKSQMTATVPTKRDGQMIILAVAELVPGDIIFLRGGNIVPADAEWLEGDEMQVDTAALTGEPIPRKVPRADRHGEEPGAGRELLSGCIIRQGEGHCLVRKTGMNTEIGQAACLVQESSGHTAGVFETKIMQVVKSVILFSLIDAAVLLYIQVVARGDRQGFKESLLAVLAVVIGAVPIALPLVMQVTMAIGAGAMAKRKAIVTHLTALQEIASMTVLCSDKTGTLTTADMRVMPSSIWIKGDHSQDDALIWAGVASNPANKEDPIDNSVLKSCVDHFGGEQEADAKLAPYKKSKFVGFNPTVKRTVVYCEHPQRGKVKLAKGLTSKVLSTGDDGGDCWECEDANGMKAEVQEADAQFSKQGYKTLGVALAQNGGPMTFVAIVPMLDPPREDTMLTIYRIRQAGVGVKMATGDHLNIAIETSRLIGLGTNVRPATDLWPASAERDELIVLADGFAQVLPKDKREMILVLQNRGLVVGMTGDGVNDAPALAQAQIGIAVDGATEAARSAADIILTTPGLTAIFDAVVESRKIFARLRAYVLYRMAATIQIVVVLSVMIYGYEIVMNPLYVILLALFNDISMLPIANDNASASPLPEIPSMPQILLASCVYGAILTLQSIGLFEFVLRSDWLSGEKKICDPTSCDYISTVVYLQISIAIEFVIFSCRAPGFCLAPKFLCGGGRPSMALFSGVMLANIVVTVLAGFGVVIFKIDWSDLGYIWLYNFIFLVLTDLFKVFLGVSGLPWMSAGASIGVLGYPDLPRDGDHVQTIGGTSLRSQLVQSHLAQHSLLASGRSLRAGGSTLREPRSASMLPFPHNLRADLGRAYNSFGESA